MKSYKSLSDSYVGHKHWIPLTLQLPPPPPPPPNFCQLNLTKSYNVLANLPQLQGPQNCLRMPQNHSQKAQNSKQIRGGHARIALDTRVGYDGFTRLNHMDL